MYLYHEENVVITESGGLIIHALVQLVHMRHFVSLAQV